MNHFYKSVIKRLIDLSLAIFLLPIMLIPLVVIGIFVKLSSEGPVIHWSHRIGRDNKSFLMPKFRTMKVETPQIPTHLLLNPEEFLIPFGRLLRMSSLDELPQLFSVLTGAMSFVGPRPSLDNEADLIRLRAESGVSRLTPGITGWAQINGRDDLLPAQKAAFDAEYLQRCSFIFDVRILMITAIKVLNIENIAH